MRIAFLGPSYPWRGGIAKFAQNLGDKYRSAGHEVMMFTFMHQYPSLLFPASNQLETGQDNQGLATQKVLTTYNPFTWMSTVHEIKNWHPDILIISYWIPFMAPAYGFILRFLKKIRKVYLLHNVVFHEKWLGGEQLTRFALSPADLYVTLSDVTLLSLKQMFKGKKDNSILPLFHPVYEQYHADVNDSSEVHKKILFFGFIKYYKGLDLLIEAMPLVNTKIPDLKLVIAGDVYGDKKPYLDQIDRLGLRNSIEMHFEYIPEEKISEYFNNADLCVIPYRSATQSGVVQLSFAFEVPVIATRVGGIEELVIDGKTGLLVEPGNHVALAEAIIRFYTQDFTKTFKENIREQNSHYSWDQFAKQLLDRLA